MKYLLFIACIILLLRNSNGQTKEQTLKEYFDTNKNEVMLELNHGPVSGDFGELKNAILFFVSGWDEDEVDLQTKAVIYHKNLEAVYEFGYTTFGNTNFDPSFSNGVISVFFENVDYDPENEMIVIYEHGGRTFFADGGYAGIKVWYQTLVYDLKIEKGNALILEYKTIGELLTVNAPFLMGTRTEEELIGRESGKNINEIFGVTYNANIVKKRILLLKNNGLLGANAK